MQTKPISPATGINAGIGTVRATDGTHQRRRDERDEAGNGSTQLTAEGGAAVPHARGEHLQNTVQP